MLAVVLALAPPAVLQLQPGEPAAVLAPAAALAAVASPDSGGLSPLATTSAWQKAEQLAREAEAKAKALAEAEAAEQEMASRASTTKTQEVEARLVAERKKEEAKEELPVAQQAERQAVTAVQEAEQLLRDATAKAAQAERMKSEIAHGISVSSNSAFREVSAVSSVEQTHGANAHPLAEGIRADIMRADSVHAAAMQPAAAQPVAVPGHEAAVSALQARKFSAQMQAATAKVDLENAFRKSKEAHRLEARALEQTTAPGLDAAAKQAAAAELAQARSRHAEAASVVEAAKARAAKAYEEVILSEAAEGAASAEASAAGQPVQAAPATEATKTRAATAYEDALAKTAQMAGEHKTGLTSEEPTTKEVSVDRNQLATMMRPLASTPYETRATKLARDRVDKALASATSKEEEVKRVEAWSVALIEAAKKKADEALRLARADVMKADDEAATKLVHFVKAKEREAAKVAEEALAKQAEAAKIAKEAADAREAANKAAHKAAQWKASAEEAVKLTAEQHGHVKLTATTMKTALAASPSKAGLVRAALSDVASPWSHPKDTAIEKIPAAPKRAARPTASTRAAGKPVIALTSKRRAALSSAANLTSTVEAAAKPKKSKTASSKSKAKRAAGTKRAALASAETAADTSIIEVTGDYEPGDEPFTKGARKMPRKMARKARKAAASVVEAETSMPASVTSLEAGAGAPGPTPHAGSAGHMVSLAWRAMRDTIMALEDARGVGQPGLQDAFTKQGNALLELTRMYPSMDDLPTVRSPDLHKLFSQSKELGGLILVEEAKTLAAAAQKELKEHSEEKKDGRAKAALRAQTEVYDALVLAEGKSRERVEEVARKVAAQKEAQRAAAAAAARQKAAELEVKDREVVTQLRQEAGRKANKALNLKVRAKQALEAAEARKKEMEAAATAARLAEEEAEVESAKAVMDEAAAAAARRREDERRREEEGRKMMKAAAAKIAAKAEAENAKQTGRKQTPSAPAGSKNEGGKQAKVALKSGKAQKGATSKLAKVVAPSKKAAAAKDKEWCFKAVATSKVASGWSWGSLTKAGIKEWGTRGCEAIVPPLSVRNAGDHAKFCLGDDGKPLGSNRVECNQAWCKRMTKEFDVVSGVSWGTLPEPARELWGQRGCTDGHSAKDAGRSMNLRQQRTEAAADSAPQRPAKASAQGAKQHAKQDAKQGHGDSSLDDALRSAERLANRAFSTERSHSTRTQLHDQKAAANQMSE